MPLTERDPNFSGRMSRASNMSTGSRGLQKGNAAKPDFFFNAPGVMSMPRTPTEPGDIGTLTFDPSHLPSMPRAPQIHRRSSAASHLSTGSAHSQTSKRASNYHVQLFGSSSARHSLTRDTNVSQYLPDTLSPTVMSLQGLSPLIPHARLSRDGRSFSMTHTSQPTYTLSSHRSFASLRNHDIIHRPRSPYRYPTRLRRPGYRPSSPAMSHITGTEPRRLQGQSFVSGLRAPFGAPMAAVLRTRSLSLGGNKDHRASFESKLARRSLRSLISYTTDRPWNVDKNYPWVDDMPAIDISLPAPTHLRDASQPRASNLCLSASSDGSQSDYGVYDESAVSPIMGESASSGDPSKHTRKASKHSILGSISRRIGIYSGPLNTTGYAIGPDGPRNDDHSVDPGDRYPTTDLTPPSALNPEEVRSFFSDDSSRSQRGGSFRKRLMHLKAKLPPVARSHSALENHCLQNGDGSSKDSMFVIRPGGSMHTYDSTVGISRMEFRARKVAEKIKTLWFRSRELLRSISGRRKLSQEARDWLQDSEVYSGTRKTSRSGGI